MSDGTAGRASWRQDLAAAFRVMWLPLLPSTLIVVGGYLLWQYATGREQRLRDAVVESEAGRVQEELARALDQRAAALARYVASRRAPAPGDSARLDAEFGRDRLPFRAVVALDSSLALIGALPRGVRVTAALDPGEDAARSTALRVVTEIPGADPAVVTTTALASGGRQVLVCAPVPGGGRAGGFIVGVSRMRDVLDEVLTRTVGRGFAVGVFEGPEIVYGTRLEDGGPGIESVREFVVSRDALVWRIEIWPGEELSRSLDSHAPAALLLAALVLGFFVALTIHQWRERAAAESGAENVVPRKITEEGRL